MNYSSPFLPRISFQLLSLLLFHCSSHFPGSHLLSSLSSWDDAWCCAGYLLPLSGTVSDLPLPGSATPFSFSSCPLSAEDETIKSVHNVQKVNSISNICCSTLSCGLSAFRVDQPEMPPTGLFKSTLYLLPWACPVNFPNRRLLFNVWVFSVWNPKGEKENGGEGWKKRYQFLNLVSQRVGEFEATVKLQCQEPLVCNYFKQSRSSCAWQILPSTMGLGMKRLLLSRMLTVLEYFWKSNLQSVPFQDRKKKVKDWTSVLGHPEKVLMTQFPLYLLSYFWPSRAWHGRDCEAMRHSRTLLLSWYPSHPLTTVQSNFRVQFWVTQTQSLFKMPMHVLLIKLTVPS